mmetsp:Transcript_34072/g.42083  ORF Transcript_34072/g.42083 Transcript_34072/m.42083 type:complete len:253 (+) Transcript_34072:2542-3300(+)
MQRLEIFLNGCSLRRSIAFLAFDSDGRPGSQTLNVAKAVSCVVVDYLPIVLIEVKEHKLVDIVLIVEEEAKAVVAVHHVDEVAAFDHLVGQGDGLPCLEVCRLVDHLIPDIVGAEVDHFVGCVVARDRVSRVAVRDRRHRVVRIVTHDRLLRVPSRVLELARHVKGDLVGGGHANQRGFPLWVPVELIRHVGASPVEHEVAWELAPSGQLLLLNGHFVLDEIPGLVRVGDAQQEDAEEEEDRQREEADDGEA